MRITFNGKDYLSVEDMPHDVRADYKAAMRMLPDDDKNGIPDLLQETATLDGKVATAKVVSHSFKFITNQGGGGKGKTVQYNSLDEMPPDLRAECEEAIREMERHGELPESARELLLKDQPREEGHHSGAAAQQEQLHNIPLDPLPYPRTGYFRLLIVITVLIALAVAGYLLAR